MKSSPPGVDADDDFVHGLCGLHTGVCDSVGVGPDLTAGPANPLIRCVFGPTPFRPPDGRPGITITCNIGEYVTEAPSDFTVRSGKWYRHACLLWSASGLAFGPNSSRA
jgi:hypothetical protein